MKKRNKKKIKNPVDDYFVLFLVDAITHNDPKHLSDAFSYKTLGAEPCEDCDEIYDYCACEGSRTIPGNPCEECKQNRCLCDYNITGEHSLRKAVVIAAIKNLNREQLTFFENKLKKYEETLGSRSALTMRANQALKILNDYKIF